MKKKTIAMLMAAAMLCSGAAGATMAWLTATTTQVVNTFTYGDINLTLDETKPVGRIAKMMPGSVIEKDPKVTVEAGSEDSWVFVKIEKANDFDTYMEFEVAEGWTSLGVAYPGVYYREYATNIDDESYYILGDSDTEYSDGCVKVKEDVTKEQFKEIGTNYPQLKFTGYAVQKENIATAADAWAKITPQTNP